jgi:pimeloyl-ACP methyl ester carboxylesterase
MRFLFLLLFALAGFAQTRLESYDGRSRPAESGRISVLENRRNPRGHRIEVAYMRLRSTAARPRAPIVFLAGGPGIPGSGLARVPVYFDFFEKLTGFADVILLDQRGSGLSSPNLNDCPAKAPLSADAFSNRKTLSTALTQAITDCAAYWQEKNVDLTGYNTEESAADIEDLRLALHAGKLSLLAHSYGTELALNYIRRYPDNVESAVLAGTEGPGDHGSMPDAFDIQLQKISALAGEDLTALLTRATARLTPPVPLPVARGGDTINVATGDIALRFLTEQLLADGRRISLLPQLLETVANGDYSVLTPMIVNLYDGFSAGVTLMGRAINCAAARPLAPSVFESQFRDIVRIDLRPEICQAANGGFTLPAKYFEPIYSPARVLFLSGALDANTPPAKAERVRWGFPNATHLLVANGFHEILPAPEVQSLVADFLRSQDVASGALRLQSPVFLSLEDARKSAATRR